jgi:hypothetical protein
MATVRKSKAAKPSVKPGKLPAGAKADERAARDKEMGETIVERRNEGEKYAPIAADLGITVGKAIFLYECATVEPKNKITFRTEEDLGKKIVAARDKGLSWGRIAAYSGVPEGRVRKVWEETTGQSAMGQSIGKGGRTPNGVVKAKPKAKAKPAVKAAAKPAATKPAPAAKAKAPIKRTIKRRTPAA